MMVDELYDALIEAGASPEKAKSAARALANYDNRFTKIETDLAVLKWMVGFTLALCMAMLFLLYQVLSRLH